MTLRRRTLIIIGMTLASLIIIQYAASRLILMSSFAKLEEQDTRRNVDRVLGILNENIANLNINASDWAAWDDTYKFIEDVNEKYIVSNLNDKTLPQLRLDLLLFVNSSGEVVFGKGCDLDNDREVPVPESIKEHLFSNRFLLNHSDTDSSLTGILLLPEGPMLIASRPIVTSEFKGPIRGTLIMGRYLDSDEIQRMAETTHLSFTVFQYNDLQLPSDFQTARSSLSEETQVLIVPLNEDFIAGYTLLKDVYGNPCLLLKTDIPRDIYKQGQATMLYFIVSLVVVGIIFAFITIMLLKGLILSRLAILSASVRDIGIKSNPSERVSLSGEDELSDLSNIINATLTSLEHSQRQIQESEERYRNLFETMIQGVIYKNFSGEIISANPSAEKILGLTVEQMLSQKSVDSYLRTIHEDGTCFLEDEHPSNKALKTGKEIHDVVMGIFNFQEGKYRWVKFTAVPQFRSGEQLPYQVYTIFDDITERVNMENELKKHRANLEEMVNKRTADLHETLAKLQTTMAQLQQETVERMQAEERFSKAFNYSPIPMGIISISNGRIIDVNDSFLDFSGHHRQEIIGCTIMELNIWEKPENYARIKQSTLEQNVVRNLEVSFYNKSNEKRFGLLSTLVIDLDGEKCFLVAINDITELRQMEKEMARLDRLYLIGEMAAGIGHEIRNPMTTVRGFLQILGKKEECIKYTEYYNLMIEELDRANAIITEFLSLAKNKTVDLMLQNLNSIIKALSPLIQSDTTKTDISFKAELEDIPELSLDEKEIRQLILNLVRNGIEAMPSGGSLSISTHTDGDEVVMAVKDQGKGIEPDVLEKLGTPFFTTKDQGTGLGLAVCYSIAARHNAVINIKTGSDGTTFLVQFKSSQQHQPH